MFGLEVTIMEKNIVTECQMKALKNAFEGAVGTKDYGKYACEWHFKSGKTGSWKFSVYGSPAAFSKGYFKTIRGDTYIYSMDRNERVRLSDECKKILGIA